MSFLKSIKSKNQTHNNFLTSHLNQPKNPSSSSSSPSQIPPLNANHPTHPILTPAILHQICTHLHFPSLLSLRLTCKTLYSLLPLSTCHELSCTPGSKTLCWGCGTQICTDCTSLLPVPDPGSTPHLTHCSPRCRECFKDAIKTQKQKRCGCVSKGGGDVREGIYIPQGREGRGGGYYNGGGQQVRKVCGMCKNRGGETVGFLRERRERVEARRTAEWGRCEECLVGFERKSEMWWVCGKCKGECKWDGHVV